MKIPFTIGVVHFVGVGGAGMSGLAAAMRALDFDVQGSDIKDSPALARLREAGVRVFVGHLPEHLGEARVVVVSSAVLSDNPEIRAARERGLPVIPRAEMLAELMRFRWSIAVAGSHGKTTTSSMIAAAMEGAGMNPWVITGGVVNAWNDSIRRGASGDGGWMVVESDESDGGFVKLPMSVGVVTNIDQEHMDHYADMDALIAAFEMFVRNAPFYGFVAACVDCPRARGLVASAADRRFITYGVNPTADVRAIEPIPRAGGIAFEVLRRPAPNEAHRLLGRVDLPMPGEHNMVNALAAIAVSMELGAEWEAVRDALARFGGVNRRFTHIGGWKGMAMYDDYAHHPTEIAATLAAARDCAPSRLIAIAQPHRPSRLRALGKEFLVCFDEADTIFLAPVWLAGEPDGDAETLRQDLAEALREGGRRDVRLVRSPDDLAAQLAPMAQEGALAAFMGAGDITAWARAMPDLLAKAEVGR